MKNTGQFKQALGHLILKTAAQLKKDKLASVDGCLLLSYLKGVDQVVDFSLYWNNLVTDNFMADGGSYRLRRYGQFEINSGSMLLRQLRHQSYSQPGSVNKLNGGIKRVFEPLEKSFCSNSLLLNYLGFLRQVYDHARGERCDWNIRLHPYRVLASSANSGLPTPEGLHRDGVTFISALMIRRFNILGGETTVTDMDEKPLFRQQLHHPFDLLVGDDKVTKHMVSPISPNDLSLKDAYRDVLVVAFTEHHLNNKKVA